MQELFITVYHYHNCVAYCNFITVTLYRAVHPDIATRCSRLHVVYMLITQPGTMHTIVGVG